MKKFLTALLLGVFSLSAFAAGTDVVKAKPKAHAHKHHKKTKKHKH